MRPIGDKQLARWFCSPLDNEYQYRAFLLSNESILDVDFHAKLDTFLRGLAPNIFFENFFDCQRPCKLSGNYGPGL